MQVLKGSGQKIHRICISPDTRFAVAYTGSDSSLHLQVWDLTASRRTIKLFPDTSVLTVEFLNTVEIFANVRGEHWYRVNVADGSLAELDARPYRALRSAAVCPSRGIVKGFVSYFGTGVEPAGEAFGLVTYKVTPTGLYLLDRKLPLRTERSWTDTVQFHPSSDRYLVRLETNHYRLCDAETDQNLQEFRRPNENQHHFFPPCFSHNGSRFYLQHRRGIDVFDTEESSPPTAAIDNLPRAELRSMAVHPGNRILAATDGNPAITFYDAETLQTLRTFDFNLGNATCVTFTPDGTRCVVGYARGKILLFDVDE